MSSHFQEVEEEYMEMLWELHVAADGAPIRTGDLAEAMDVSPASATEMVQRLSEKGFLVYERYKGVRLSENGLVYAQRMKRRHQLARTFLVRLLGYEGDVEDAACRLEHAIDEQLEATLDRLLDHPTHTPGGERIPRSGKVTEPAATSWRPLAALAAGEVGTVRAVVLPAGEAGLLAEQGLAAGARIEMQADGPRLKTGLLQADEVLLGRILVE